MYGGGNVYFSCPNMDVVKIHLDKFQKALNEMEKNEKLECFIFSDDNEGNHVGMVRATRISGYYLCKIEPKSGEEWRGE